MKMFRALTNAAILAAVLIAVALLLTGCIVEPIGPYGHERPYYSGWRLLMRKLIFVAALALLPVVANAKDLLVVTMSATVSGGAHPVVTGRTNLPDGMQLAVQLAHPCDQDLERRFMELDRGHFFPTCINQQDIIRADAVVTKGQFRTGPWGYGAAQGPPGLSVTPGQYVLYVFSPGLDLEPAEVRTVTGEEGQNMAGPLINRAMIGYVHVAWYANVTVR